ncbi:MAG: tetratricopeptide repeat protein [Bdellovibrionales bacterium]
MANWLKSISWTLASATLLIGFAALAQFEDSEIDEADQAGVSEPSKLEVDSKDLKALAEARANKSEEALVRAASRVLGADSKNLIALNTLGVFYFEQGKYGLARIIFLRALRDHNQTPALHNNLGIVYLAEGKQRQALAEFRKALEIKSDYRVSAANLGSIFLEYKDFERALKPLESGYKATRSELKSGTPYAMEVANNYAIALTGAGQFDAAKDVYDEIVAGSTRNPTVLLNYAILLVEKLKNYKEGSKLLSRIKFAVDDPKVLKRVEELDYKASTGGKEQ